MAGPADAQTRRQITQPQQFDAGRQSNIVPKFDEDGTVVGYIASRKMPDRSRLPTIISQYKAMIDEEKNS